MKAITDAKLTDLSIQFERGKARIRAKIVHVLQVIKAQFGYGKLRYRGPTPVDTAPSGMRPYGISRRLPRRRRA